MEIVAPRSSEKMVLIAMEKVELSGVGRGLETVPRAWNCYEQVIPDWVEATTMSILGPLTCSALTVIDPVFPPDELVCSLTMRLMPPGNEMARFGVDTRTDWPAAVKPTSSAFPVTLACVPLQVALEFDFTTSAATSPPTDLGLRPTIATGCWCHCQTRYFSARQLRPSPRH